MPGRFQYAVIRYVPNVVRDEAVNVGVLVRDAARGDFAYRFLPRSVTVRRLWPDADRQLVTNFEKQLKQLKGSQQLKLTDRATGLPGVGHPLDRDFFARAREEFNGNLQLSMERGIIAESLEEARAWAYGTYVAEPERGPRPINYQALAPQTTRERLWHAFERSGLIGPGRLEERVVIEGRRAPWTFDLGYRNGRINVINSLALTTSNAEANLGRALVLKGMVEDVTERQEVGATAVLHLANTEATTSGATQAIRLLADANIEIVALPELDSLIERVQDDLLAVTH